MFETRVTVQLAREGRAAGEPEMAVDAVHHAILMGITWVGNSSDKGAGCGYAISYTGGRTWQVFEHSPADPGPSPWSSSHDCSDPFAAAGPDGVLYVGAGWADSYNAYDIYVLRSRDGGRSWSRPLFAIGTRDRQPTDGVSDVGEESRPDRPFITVNPRTGAVALSAMQFLPPGDQRYVVISHSDGDSWGPVRPIATGHYPATGTGAEFVIPSQSANELAFAYEASPFVDNFNFYNGCPCAVFETSRDDGLTWTRHAAPFSYTQYAFPFDLTAAQVAADPARPGRFAVMALNGQAIAVSTTDDDGMTWSKTAVIPDPDGRPFQPWMAYSPGGVLGVGFKSSVAFAGGSPLTDVTDGGLTAYSSYDYWAAVSYDGGRTFGAPIQLSHAISPPDSPQDQRDDFSDVTLDRTHLYAAWGDLRTSPTNSTPTTRAIYFAALPLAVRAATTKPKKPVARPDNPTKPRKGRTRTTR